VESRAGFHDAKIEGIISAERRNCTCCCRLVEAMKGSLKKSERTDQIWRRLHKSGLHTLTGTPRDEVFEGTCFGSRVQERIRLKRVVVPQDEMRRIGGHCRHSWMM
jgi:hypothetical protein